MPKQINTNDYSKVNISSYLYILFNLSEKCYQKAKEGNSHFIKYLLGVRHRLEFPCAGLNFVEMLY